MLGNKLPPDKGVYVLHLYLEQDADLIVGALGEVHFPRGNYFYVGSAFGPGGLRARLGRHIRGDRKIQWHIDVLRRAARVVGYCFYSPIEGDEDQTVEIDGSPKSYECRWSQALAALPEGSVPVPGFGASDCRSGCVSHLIAINMPQETSESKRFMRRLIASLARSAHIETADLECIYTSGIAYSL